MADEKDDFPSVVAGLNVSQAVDRLFAKTKDARCPICGNPDWLVESGGPFGGDDVPTPAFLLKDARGYWGPIPSVAAAALSCSNCGFIRLHNLTVLNDGK